MRCLLSKMRKLILKPFSVMGRGKNRYVGFGYFARLRSLTIVGKGNSIELKSSLPSSVRIVIYGNNNHLVIDKNVNYKAGLIWIEDNECEIRVGQKTTIESATLSVAEDGSKIIIGEDCMISKDVRFATSDAHSIIDLSTGKRTNFAKDIIIDNHVWIGNGVFINKGCHIGHGAIIAGRSVVTHDVPALSIAAGIAARVVKDHVSWDRRRL